MSLFDRAHMTSYWRSIVTMDLPSTVSEIDCDFRWKSQNFPTPLYFAPLLKGFPWELGIGARGQKSRIMWLPGWEKSLTICSAIWIQCINVMDRQTDGRTDTGRQQRPRLRVASRGKYKQIQNIIPRLLHCWLFS